MKRGQISVEYIVILGVILLAIVILVYFSFSKASQETNLNDAENAIATLQSALDRIYTLGPGNQEVVKVIFPQGFSSAILSTDSKTIIMKIQGNAGVSDFTATAKTTLQLTNFPQTPGIHYITIKYLDDGTLIELTG